MSKFPFYKQLDGMDCGPSCLRMIAKYYGKTFSVQQLREQSYIQRTGVNLLGISEAAASIGLRATGIRTSMEKLKQHWNQEHFVVLYKIEKKRGKTWFYIADPAYGLLKYEEQELKKCWISTTQGGIEKGIALLLDVTPQFYEAEPIKYEKLSLWYLFHYVRPYKKAMIQLIIGLLAGSLLQLVFPFLTQTIVDQGIGHRNLNFIQLILAAQLMLVFSRTLIEVIRRCILLHISTRVNVSLISDFLSKLMRLPMRVFGRRLDTPHRRPQPHREFPHPVRAQYFVLYPHGSHLRYRTGHIQLENIPHFHSVQRSLYGLGKAVHAQAGRLEQEEL